MEAIKKRKELIIAITITLIFFVIFNIFFQLKYEEIDDFVMMNLISAADGNYSIYGIFIHPMICTIIMLLFKTSININWYTIVILAIQFASFSAIGTILIKKNKKTGVILYLFLILVIYSKLLLYIQFTSTSALALIAGVILIIYSKEIQEYKNKYFIYGLIFIAIGAMLRFSSCIMTIPFLGIYYIYDMIKNKKIKKDIIDILIIISVLVSVYISNAIVYYINPTYREHTKFNKVRSQILDSEKIDYKGNKEKLLEKGWSVNDVEAFYAYLFADEKVYNTESIESLVKIKQEMQEIDPINQIRKSFKQYSIEAMTTYNIPTYLLLILTLLSINQNKEKEKQLLIATIFVMTIGMHIGFWYIGRAPLRVVISAYIIGISLSMYLFPKIEIKKKMDKCLLTILLCILAIFSLKNTYKDSKRVNINSFSLLRQVIEYTNEHKENVYMYTTLSMRGRFISYSIYEKIPDNTFSNLQPIADWTIYTKNYYDFKERYNLDNIVEDLYLKDNVYLIDQETKNKVYLNILKRYIKEHYNKDIEYEEIEDFNNIIKIYKLKESSEM